MKSKFLLLIGIMLISASSMASMLNTSVTEDVSDQITVVVDIGIEAAATVNVDLQSYEMDLGAKESYLTIVATPGEIVKYADVPMKVGWLDNADGIRNNSQETISNSLYTAIHYEPTNLVSKNRIQRTLNKSIFIKYKNNTFRC